MSIISYRPVVFTWNRMDSKSLFNYERDGWKSRRHRLLNNTIDETREMCVYSHGDGATKQIVHHQ